MKEQGFFTIGEVARYLDIKVKSLYVKVPEIPHYRVGRLLRFRKEDIDAWMESRGEMVRQLRQVDVER